MIPAMLVLINVWYIFNFAGNGALYYIARLICIHVWLLSYSILLEMESYTIIYSYQLDFCMATELSTII